MRYFFEDNWTVVLVVLVVALSATLGAVAVTRGHVRVSWPSSCGAGHYAIILMPRFIGKVMSMQPLPVWRCDRWERGEKP